MQAPVVSYRHESRFVVPFVLLHEQWYIKQLNGACKRMEKDDPAARLHTSIVTGKVAGAALVSVRSVRDHSNVESNSTTLVATYVFTCDGANHHTYATMLEAEALAMAEEMGNKERSLREADATLRAAVAVAGRIEEELEGVRVRHAAAIVAVEEARAAVEAATAAAETE